MHAFGQPQRYFWQFDAWFGREHPPNPTTALPAHQ